MHAARAAVTQPRVARLPEPVVEVGQAREAILRRSGVVVAASPEAARTAVPPAQPPHNKAIVGMPTTWTQCIDAGVLACIGLGANLGDAGATLRSAQDALAVLPMSALVTVSPVYRSAPIDATGPDYLNTVALLRTTLDARALLRELQRIEFDHGRERSFHNAPRTLDLDLLLYGAESIATPELTVPHPRMQERAFVLRPLLDVLPSAMIPGLGPAAVFLLKVTDQRITRVNP